MTSDARLLSQRQRLCHSSNRDDERRACCFMTAKNVFETSRKKSKRTERTICSCSSAAISANRLR